MPSKDPLTPQPLTRQASVDIPTSSDQEYSVYHVNRDAPDHVHLDVITAPNEDDACRLAQQIFPGSTIVRVNVSDNQDPGAPYPRAKFINGEFHAIGGGANNQAIGADQD